MLGTKELLDCVEAALEAAGGPVEIGDLVDALKASGAIEPEMDRARAKHTLYNKVWLEAKTLGDASRWQRVGRGRWCLVKHLTPEMLVGDAAKIRTLDERRLEAKMEGRRPRVKPEEVPDEERRCGNCTSLRFYGVHFLKLDSGSCERWPESVADRPYPRVEQPACHLWRRRTAAQREADKRESRNDLIEILGINMGRPRERGNKRSVPITATVIRAETREEDDGE